jgi:hypothetical protein
MMKTRWKNVALLLPFLFVAIVPAPLHGQARSDGGIMFLRMALHDGKVRLVGSDVRPGILKGRPASLQSNRVVVDVLSANGTLLWSGSVPDPSVRRYEYEDPARPGTLVPVAVTREATEFSVRIPSLPDMDRVEFSRFESRSGTAGPVVRRSLGVVYPAAGGGVR